MTSLKNPERNPGWYLAADDPGEVGLLRRVDVEFGLIGSLAPILSADLQGQGVVVTHVDLVTVAAANGDEMLVLYLSPILLKRKNSRVQKN